MIKWMLAAGAAALAIAAPLSAERGGKGGGKDHSASAQKADRGGKKSHAERGDKRQAQADKPNRGKGKERQARAAKDDNRGRGPAGNFNRPDKRASDRAFAERRDDRARGRDDIRTVLVGRGGSDAFRVRDIDRDGRFARRLGFGGDGCPPGLAKKPIACMPPGQAAKFIGQPLGAAARIAALDPLPRSLRDLYWDNDDHYYRWGGGYLYRVDRDNDLIASMIPLFGAALLGQPLQPNYLNNYYQPSYFSAFYPSSSRDCYRYGYGYVYETDCATGFVEDVIPTYDNGYGVGQLLPSSYGYYNVPFAYRGAFADNDDYYYRYAPGAIYRVDRGTALISAVAALLTSGLSVGQPLPTGYSAYNVPLAYRADYYDRPDVWYRYDNGHIYAVDPGTRMVRSVAYTIV